MSTLLHGKFVDPILEGSVRIKAGRHLHGQSDLVGALAAGRVISVSRNFDATDILGATFLCAAPTSQSSTYNVTIGSPVIPGRRAAVRRQPDVRDEPRELERSGFLRNRGAVSEDSGGCFDRGECRRERWFASRGIAGCISSATQRQPIRFASATGWS